MAKPIQLKLCRTSPTHHSCYHTMAKLVNLFPSEFEIVIVKGSCFILLQLTGFWDLIVTPLETLHLKISCLIRILKATTERSLVEEIGSETAYQSTMRPICGSKSLTCSRRKTIVREHHTWYLQINRNFKFCRAVWNGSLTGDKLSDFLQPQVAQKTHVEILIIWFYHLGSPQTIKTVCHHHSANFFVPLLILGGGEWGRVLRVIQAPLLSKRIVFVWKVFKERNGRLSIISK